MLKIKRTSTVGGSTIKVVGWYKVIDDSGWIVAMSRDKSVAEAIKAMLEIQIELPVRGTCECCGNEFSSTSKSYPNGYDGKCPSCSHYGQRVT